MTLLVSAAIALADRLGLEEGLKEVDVDTACRTSVERSGIVCGDAHVRTHHIMCVNPASPRVLRPRWPYRGT